MSETPKEKPECQNDKPDERKKKDSWEADQKKHDYYYDDSHGYETYNPEKDQGNDE